MSLTGEIIRTLGNKQVIYTPKLGSPKTVWAMVDPLRRIDNLGNQSFLTKTYEIWLVKGSDEGIPTVTVNVDTLRCKINESDAAETLLKITKIYPEQDDGAPGDGSAMWHLEAVA